MFSNVNFVFSRRAVNIRFQKDNVRQFNNLVNGLKWDYGILTQFYHSSTLTRPQFHKIKLVISIQNSLIVFCPFFRSISKDQDFIYLIYAA